MSKGKQFRKPAKTQREIIGLLRASPLPWTAGMLKSWFGTRHGNPFDNAVMLGRVQRVERGLYTCRTGISSRPSCRDRGNDVADRRLPPAPSITDEMLERFGYKL